MTDSDGTGIYRATITETTVPERYSFSVTALGLTQGITFRREGTQQTYVLVKPNPKFSKIDINYLKAGQAQVTVFPRDEFDNVLLIDPETAAQFGLLGPSGKFLQMQSSLTAVT